MLLGILIYFGGLALAFSGVALIPKKVFTIPMFLIGVLGMLGGLIILALTRGGP